MSVLAVRRGGDEERLGAGAIVLGWAMSLMMFKAQSEQTQWKVLLVDGAELPLFLWLALRSARWWPMFAAAFKLLIVGTHMAHALEAAVSGWAYLTAVRIWSYLALFAVSYGAWSAPKAAAGAAPAPVPGATRR